MSNSFLNIQEVAARFGRSTSWLYQHYKTIAGFPRPIRLNGYNLQWNSAEVDIWFASRVNPAYRINDNAAGVYDKLLAANAALL